MSASFQEEDNDKFLSTPSPQEERAMQQSVLDTLVQSKPEFVLAAGLPPTTEQTTPGPASNARADASAHWNGATKTNPAAPFSSFKRADSLSATAAERAGDSRTQRTVFVRGLPARTSQQQLHAVMLSFGAVQSCR